jgi:hypothetical protein
MKRWMRSIAGQAFAAAALALPLTVGAVSAQSLTPDPGPEEERLPAMTREHAR